MPLVVVKLGADASSLRETSARHGARKSNGDLWVIYTRGAPGAHNVYCSVSVDGGATWNEELVSTSGGDHIYTTIAIDANDDVHTAWTGKDYGVNIGIPNIQYRLKIGAVWQAVELVCDEPNDQYDPAICIDSANDAHLAWTGYHHGTFLGAVNAVYRKRTGGVWGAIELITDINSFQTQPSITIDNTGKIHVAWRSKGFGVNVGWNNIKYKARNGAWGAIESITDVAAVQNTPCIALDSGEIPHITWAGYGWDAFATYNIEYINRIGGAWGAREAVTALNFDQRNSSVSLDAADDVNVCWDGKGWGGVPGQFNIQHRKRTIGVWGAVTSITDRNFQEEGSNLIWARYPTAPQTNVPTLGFALFIVGQIAGGYQIEYLASADLAWPAGGGGNIAAVGGVAWANIGKIKGVLKANIAQVAGVAV